MKIKTRTQVHDLETAAALLNMAASRLETAAEPSLAGLVRSAAQKADLALTAATQEQP